LAAEFTVYACNVRNERADGMRAIDVTKGNQKALVLIHQEPCGDRVDITGWKKENPPGLYVMYVHGSGCSPIEEKLKWVYAARRPVLSNADLGYLRREFASLRENLEKAVSEEEITGAWHAFDRNPLAELLEALSSISITSCGLPEIDSYLGRVLDGKDEAWRKYAASEIGRIVKDTVRVKNGESLANTLLHANGEGIVNQMRKDPEFVLDLARWNL